MSPSASVFDADTIEYHVYVILVVQMHSYSCELGSLLLLEKICALFGGMFAMVCGVS